MDKKTSRILLLVVLIILVLSLIFLWYLSIDLSRGGTKLLIVETSCPEKFEQEWYKVDIVYVSATKCSPGIIDPPKKIIYTKYANGSEVPFGNTSSMFSDTYMLMDTAYLNWKEQNYSANVLYVDADNDGNISVGDYILLKSRDAGGFFTEDMRVGISGDYVSGQSAVGC